MTMIREVKINETLSTLDYIKEYEITGVSQTINPNRKYRTIIFIDVIINFSLYMAVVLTTDKKLEDIQTLGYNTKIVYNIIHG